MQCFSPIHVPDPKHEGKLNTVPCGKCPACVQNRSVDWYVRLKFESQLAENCVFVTLTYDDDHLPTPRVDDEGRIHFDVSKDDLIHYHYRLRKSLGSRSKKVKYFAVSEYGPNPENGWLFRPHYHIIYINLMPYEYDLVEKAWNKGFTTFGEITDGRIRYVSGYCTEKLFVPSGAKPSFLLASKGLGSLYVSQYRTFHEGQLDRFFVPLEGKKYPMPRYYKERLFSDLERRVFAKKMEQQSEEKYQKDLHACNGDVDRLQSLYHDVRANFVRKLRKKHKKKQNI